MSAADPSDQEDPFTVYLDKDEQQTVVNFKIKGKSMAIGLSPGMTRSLRQDLEAAEDELFADEEGKT